MTQGRADLVGPVHIDGYVPKLALLNRLKAGLTRELEQCAASDRDRARLAESINLVADIADDLTRMSQRYRAALNLGWVGSAIEERPHAAVVH